jgi:alkanesulfonate monooxygenase SsuD/methylene tetrahydromethanopterin reductase-like flavin-dependent oxidoreductase (luciferase family)
MPRKLHLAVAVYGVGGPGQHGLWKDARVPDNASTDIRYYIKTAQVAEQALFDALFIVDSQFINATYPSQKPGLFRTSYEGDTLRENLGLPFPVNRHTLERETPAEP